MSRVLFIGHSHIVALMRAAEGGAETADLEPVFLPLRDPSVLADLGPGLGAKERKARASMPEGVDRAEVATRISKAEADAAVLCVNGNEHGPLGLFGNASSISQRKAHLERMIRRGLTAWMDWLLPSLPARVLMLAPPPPVALDKLDGHFPPERISAFRGLPLESPDVRLALWRHQCEIMRALSAARGIDFIAPPAETTDAEGFLRTTFHGADPMHGNAAYGARVLLSVAQLLNEEPTPAAPGINKAQRHPYAGLPDHCFWRPSVSNIAPDEVDPVVDVPFQISPRDRVATAGSCFAQHISKRLQRCGYRYFVAEAAPPGEAAPDFSASYGNIYTARQLKQLFDRAFGYFRPLERAWQRPDGRWCDPFRPRMNTAGHASAEAVEQDTRAHLAAVRRLFRQLDVLVFTLGLTECWASRLDDAVYPLAPGATGGEFEPERHVFLNLGVKEIVADLDAFLSKLRLLNPKARVVLTVSPVPLVATAEPRHVLVSTAHSKAVLRVAAEEFCRKHEGVLYFPSYEIITGPHAGGHYFEADRRSVTEAGVDHVMRVFMRHLASGVADQIPELDALAALGETVCDEEVLTRQR